MIHPKLSWWAALLFLLALLLLYIGYRLGKTNHNTNIPLSTQDLNELHNFETQRLRDSAQAAQQRSAQWAAQKAEWTAQKAARLQARAEREDSFAAHKRRWAAQKAARQAAAQARQAYWDSVRNTRPQKLSAGQSIDLNQADTLQLQQIPGIATGLSRSIVRYRERLGGFVKASQVHEIPHIPQGIERWFYIKPTPPPRQLPINTADFKTLLAHPYLHYEQVKEIVNRRQKTGKLRSWSDLRNSPHFSEKDFERLTPYIQF